MIDGHMAQCEPCIQIIKNNKHEKGMSKGMKKMGKWERKRKRKKKVFSLLSKIYKNRAVGFRRSENKS